MTDGSSKDPDFWDGLAVHVATKVEPVLRQGPRAREPVIAYLRDLEAVARQECDSRGVIQILASARRILGDRDQIEPANGPFSRT